LPASAIVVALVMAAWARPLEPQLCRALALAGVATASTAALSAFPDRDRRAGALVLALASGSALMHLFAREVALFEVSTPRVVHLSPLLATFAVVLDAGTLALTGVYLSERKSRRLALGGGGVLVLSLALSWLAHRGALPGAGAASVLAARALAQLSLAPRPALPELVRFMLLLGTLLVAALALGQRAERARNGTVMALCLLSLGAPDVPLPALWLVLAALLCPNFGTGLDTPAPALRASED
jgi:hypothetical protein